MLRTIPTHRKALSLTFRKGDTCLLSLNKIERLRQKEVGSQKIVAQPTGLFKNQTNHGSYPLRFSLVTASQAHEPLFFDFRSAHWRTRRCHACVTCKNQSFPVQPELDTTRLWARKPDNPSTLHNALQEPPKLSSLFASPSGDSIHISNYIPITLRGSGRMASQILMNFELLVSSTAVLKACPRPCIVAAVHVSRISTTCIFELQSRAVDQPELCHAPPSAPKSHKASRHTGTPETGRNGISSSTRFRMELHLIGQKKIKKKKKNTRVSVVWVSDMYSEVFFS